MRRWWRPYIRIKLLPGDDCFHTPRRLRVECGLSRPASFYRISHGLAVEIGYGGDA